MTAPPLIIGQRLILRGLTGTDANGAYPNWLNDPRVCAGNAHGIFPYPREAALAFINASQNSRDALTLAIALRENQRHIGNISLQGIHPIYRKAEFAILLGEHDCWNKGYGKEAGMLLCRHGFDKLNLHRIECGTFANNVGMQHLAQALGMREEGRRREAAFVSGQYVDILEFGMTRDEFRAAHPEQKG